MDKKWIFLKFRASEMFFEIHQSLVKLFATWKWPGLQNARVRINVPLIANHKNVILAFFGNICFSLLNKLVYDIDKFVRSLRTLLAFFLIEKSNSVEVVRIFIGTLQALVSHPPLIWEEGETFYDMRNKMLRWLPSWQRSDVMPQQRLWLRSLILV